jgi:EAL domain-containing protein (putative c-di-GMP-specific phosphodiesterase class I)
LAISKQFNIPPDRIIFEFSETEHVSKARLIEILLEFQRQDFRLAIDDFGAGYSGLSLLANFQPDFLKLDIELVRDIDTSRARQAIAANVIRLCRDLGCRTICEGVETVEEAQALSNLGATLMQGYLFAKPGFQSLPQVAQTFRRLWSPGSQAL